MNIDSKINLAQMLQGIERYNPNNLPKLEEYVDLQVKEDFYDLEANLTVLKYYQFIPDRFNKDICIKILIKALSNMPKPDFILCKCLISPSFYEDETIKTIRNLHYDLETSQFQSFWENLNENSNLFENVKGFHEAIRKFITYIISITFERVKKDFTMDILNVNNNELMKVIKENDWQEEEDGHIFITKHINLIKNKNIPEKIDFESVFSSIIAYK